jgi:hypothetical protein
MFGFLRRRITVQSVIELTPAQLEARAIAKITDAIDTINDHIPYLHRGIRPWMDWTTLPPKLCLVRRNFQGSIEVLHPID